MREETIGGQRLVQCDCREFMPTLDSGTFDTVLTDPPYPGIKRCYGYWTEEEWHSMMDVVVPQSRRVLKPTGSAVYILQPNSEKVGRMRPWLWEFMAKWTREWGMVQDAWWWNIAALPNEACMPRNGLCRQSVKACCWFGAYDCFRRQEGVLWTETEHNTAMRATARSERRYKPSGQSTNNATACAAALRRGGVTPFNLNPIANNGPKATAFEGHGAGTPLALCDWWLRYICPPGGTVLEPFMGSGTVNVAAELQGKTGVGCETVPEYFDIACRRVEKAVRDRELTERGLLPPPTAPADDARQLSFGD